jgi:hypothetical protein
MNSSISINFINEEKAKGAEEDGTVLFLELDTKANDEKTSFIVGSRVYFRFLSSSDADYTVKVSTRVVAHPEIGGGFGSGASSQYISCGVVAEPEKGIKYEIEDDEVQFVNESEAYLQYVPCGDVSYEWIGINAGEPTFDGRKITFSDPIVGVLNCEYEIEGDRLSIVGSEVGTAIIVVIQGENQASASVTFVEEEEDPVAEEDGTILSLSLDDGKNAGQTSFVANDTAYLRFLSSSSKSYEIKVSMGEARRAATNIHYNNEDEIQFLNTDSGSLSYIPCSEVNYSWMGTDGGTPFFNGKKITLNGKKVAVLKCNYETEGDRISVGSGTAGTVVVVVIQGDNDASYTITFAEDPDDLEEPIDSVSYDLEVKDYCADGMIAGVTVYLDGEDIGQTDENGIIALGGLKPGSSHSLRMVKSGYISSEDDKLNNDSFTVPI